MKQQTFEDTVELSFGIDWDGFFLIRIHCSDQRFEFPACITRLREGCLFPTLFLQLA